MNVPQSWGARVDGYLAYRRGLGFSLTAESYYLPQFARFAEEQHAPRLTAQLAMDWARSSKRREQMTYAWRILRLRGFAKYCQKFDPDGEVPPPDVFGRTRRRLVPHIYTEREIAELLEATSRLRPREGLRPQTYRTIYALLASSGLRIGEAIRLKRADVDLQCGVLSIRRTKRHKNRFVPLHSSTISGLEAYIQQRDCKVPTPKSDHFFLLDSGKPPTAARICCGLHRLASELRWKPRGDYPQHRIQDFRHTFIVRNILRAYEGGQQIDRLVLALSTYVGHDHVADTYWYVTGIPELMSIAAERFHIYSKVLP